MLYSQALDTVFEDHDEGLATLFALALLQEPIRLSTTHAIDSPILLSPACAGDPAFLDLVRRGRFQFPRWQDGKTAKEALRTALGRRRDPYFFSGWPAKINTDEGLRKEAEQAVGTARETSDGDVNQMLEWHFKLSQAIEAAQLDSVADPMVMKKEHERAQPFAKVVKSLAGTFGTSDQSSVTPGCLRILKHLEKLDTEEQRMRSTLYYKIDRCEDSADPIDRQLAKACVDVPYNKLVAQSLELVLVSATHPTIRLFSEVHDPGAEEWSSLHAVVERLEGQPTALSWADIRDALWADEDSIRPNGSVDLTKAKSMAEYVATHVVRVEQDAEEKKVKRGWWFQASALGGITGAGAGAAVAVALPIAIAPGAQVLLVLTGGLAAAINMGLATYRAAAKNHRQQAKDRREFEISTLRTKFRGLINEAARASRRGAKRDRGGR